VGRGVKEKQGSMADKSVEIGVAFAVHKSSYAIITGKPSRKKVNVPTLFTPRGNGIDVVVSMDSIHAISKRFANTTYDGDDATVEQLKKKAKWDNDDYVKYMADDASSKKFLVNNFTNYKMTNSRPVMEQYNKLLGILRRVTQHKINIDKAIQVSCIIDKHPPSWKDFKHTLKHLKEELTLVESGIHLHIKESLRVQDSDK
nr:zinc finger, CCHC-type [Tanacetum cinerariifolium]